MLLHGHSRKENKPFKRGFKLQRDMKELGNDFLKQIHGSSDMTFQSLYDIHIKDMDSRYKENTVDGYRTVFRKLILPYFGEKR